jgi:16S rRNA (guanine527-N7)-methyltransferase
VSFPDELRKALRGAAEAEELTDEQVERLETLDRLLARWSKRVDLVGFRSEEDRVRRYFAEALAAARFLSRGPGEALDVGSGGGSPALPLAIVRPGFRFSLVESRRKRCLFLEEAVRELRLDRVRVVASRFEGMAVGGPVDAVTVRGVRMTSALLERASLWLRPGGRVLWFSSRERLESDSSGAERLSLVKLEGPLPLLPSGRGAILVLERRADPSPAARECFT